MEPIRLGSALSGGLIFQAGSRITTDDAGIDKADIRVLYAGGPLPNLIKGTPYDQIFSNGYLPATFLLDTGETEFKEGKVLGGTITFKRPNPLLTGRTKATIYVDSIVNYNSTLQDLYAPPIYTASGEPAQGKYGFPEPVVRVKYNDTVRPDFGGSTASLYALPGSSAALGFPAVGIISAPWSATIVKGSTVTYWNNSSFVSVGPLAVNTVFNFIYTFQPNPLGWQLSRLKADPVSGASFYEIELEWRNYYFYLGVTFVSKTP